MHLNLTHFVQTCKSHSKYICKSRHPQPAELSLYDGHYLGGTNPIINIQINETAVQPPVPGSTSPCPAQTLSNHLSSHSWWGPASWCAPCHLWSRVLARHRPSSAGTSTPGTRTSPSPASISPPRRDENKRSNDHRRCGCLAYFNLDRIDLNMSWSDISNVGDSKSIHRTSRCVFTPMSGFPSSFKLVPFYPFDYTPFSSKQHQIKKKYIQLIYKLASVTQHITPFWKPGLVLRDKCWSYNPTDTVVQSMKLRVPMGSINC